MCVVLSSTGSEFHSVGPETAKLRGSMRTVRVRGTARFPCVADRRRWEPLPSGKIISARTPSLDDIQAFLHVSSTNQLALVYSIDALTRDLHSWMSPNRLCVNSAKTQLLWFGTRQQLLKLDFPLLTNRFPSFTYSSSVRDLGVILDSSLTFSDHILTSTRSCYFHLRRLRAIRRSITPTVFATILHAFICSRIDYCNSLLNVLMDLLKSRLSAIQSVLNAAARLTARLPRFTHISTYLTEILHWLPIASRIKFKVLLLVTKSQFGLAPSYLADFYAQTNVSSICPPPALYCRASQTFLNGDPPSEKAEA